MWANPLVDPQGRRVADLEVRGSSLVKSSQWLAFLDHWAPTFAASGEPWMLFALHSTLNLHQGVIILARRLRRNEYWTGGTMTEQTVSLSHDARERLAWFEANSEHIDQRVLPEWAKFLFAAIQGAFRMLVRVADETEQVVRKGHLIVKVTERGDLAGDEVAGEAE